MSYQLISETKPKARKEYPCMKYVCSHCDAKSHRDTNAAFNIAARGAALMGLAESKRGFVGASDSPLSGKLSNSL